MVWDKINTNAYKPKMEYPNKPEKPYFLKKQAEDLTVEEIQQLLEAKKDYESLLEYYHQEVQLYREKERELANQFYQDLCTSYDVDPNDDFAVLMYDIAYKEGHSGGYNDIALFFCDYLVSLWEQYKKVKDGNV